MSWPQLTLWLIVLGVAIPAAFRNPTSGALALCFLFSELLYKMTGNGLAVEYFVYPDLFVLAVIFAKPSRYPCSRYVGVWHQLECLFTERSWPDRFIICSYPFVWLTYAAETTEIVRYWALWGWAIAQYLATAGEAVFDLHRRRTADATRPPQRGLLLVAYGGGFG